MADKTIAVIQIIKEIEYHCNSIIDVLIKSTVVYRECSHLIHISVCLYRFVCLFLFYRRCSLTFCITCILAVYC